tara:strand:- start:364 stop:711 length:348 start_codon:yes stop_codon:yes gene_type:complete
MSESTGEIQYGKLQDFTIDQFAGAAALILGSIGGLLMIIWKSRCICRCRLGLSDKCYIFDCSREPPPDATADSDEEQPANPQAQDPPVDDPPPAQPALIPPPPDAQPDQAPQNAP